MHIAIRLLTAAVLGCSSALGAQDGAALPAAATDYLQRSTTQAIWPRVVAGYVAGSATTAVEFAGGTAQDAGGGDRRFPLGDAASVYTGLLLADLASTGRVRLDDPIRRYLPEGFVCADERVCALTLTQLATHSSGLPPLPANLFAATANDLWRGYRETDLLEFLANYRLPAEVVARESSLGQVLLAWLLGRAHGAGFAVAVQERVLTPLDLRNTRIRRPTAAADTVQPASDNEVVALDAETSVDDQLRLLRAMLRPGESPLRAALLLSRQPRDSAGSWGLGWRIGITEQDGQPWPTVWQRGNAAGHATFFGFRADRQQALALHGDTAASLAPLGMAILADRALPIVPTAAVTAVDQSEFAGLYEFSPGVQLVVRPSAAGLTAQTSGRLSAALQPLAPDVFALSGSAVRLSFQRGALGRVDRLRWAENGVIVPVRRLSERAPRLPRGEYAVASGRLRDYCGDYRVDDDVLARFSCAGRPTLQFSGAQARELFAFADDRFSSSDDEFELLAQRGADGRVEALILVLLGSEMRLVRAHWQALPASVVDSLRDERQRQSQRMQAQTIAYAVPPAAMEWNTAVPAPWTRDLPVLPASPAAAPYRPPGTAPAGQRQPAGSGRTPVPASVRAAPPAAPAKVENLPERFQRPRFAPPQTPQQPQQENEARDGTQR